MSHFVLRKLVDVLGLEPKDPEKWYRGSEGNLDKALKERWSIQKVIAQVRHWHGRYGTQKGLNFLFITSGFTLYLQYYLAFGKSKLEGPTEARGSDANVLSILDEFKAWLGQALAQTASAAKLTEFYRVLQPRLASNPELVSELENHYTTETKTSSPTHVSREEMGAVESKALTPERVAPLRPDLARMQAELDALYAQEEAMRAEISRQLGHPVSMEEYHRVVATYQHYKEQGLPEATYVNAAAASGQ